MLAPFFILFFKPNFGFFTSSFGLSGKTPKKIQNFLKILGVGGVFVLYFYLKNGKITIIRT